MTNKSSHKKPEMAEAKASKLLSYILRHKPQSIGLHLDREGWAKIDELLAKLAQQGSYIYYKQLLKIVEQNDKKRFAISEDGSCIRALQGHSTKQVDIYFEPQVPPEKLFHGTAKRFLPSIAKQGLLPGKRHYVHLSTDIITAEEVGRRYGEVSILMVDAQKMHKDGHVFYLSENGVWLTEAVAIDYLEPFQGQISSDVIQ